MCKSPKSLHKPMEIDFTRTASYRWLNKPVLKSVLLDGMEDESTWQHIGVGEMSFTQERFVDGKQSLRLTSKTKMATDIKPDDMQNYGRPFGEAVCRRVFNGEDWKDYNRLSVWVYPTLPGFRVISMYMKLLNAGEVKLPDSYEREGLNFFLLQPDQWNHVVWEIASLDRDKVVGVDIIYRMQGNEPEATDTVCFDIDKLELQQVEADHYEGWNVAPGTISFSHTGYQAGATKTAIANGIDAKEFSLVNTDTDKVVLTKPIEKISSYIGEFQLMDFSVIEEEGNYAITVGTLKTQRFTIDKNVWRGTIWKTINLFFCQRCGFEVPGIHGICHRDWQCEHEGRKIIINGGWHDAGDLSQGVCNTTEAVYAMFHLAEKVKHEDQELYERLIEEAKWGLDWVLKTRFGDGYRSVWATMDFWTDGIIGTFDDIIFKGRNSPFDNLVTSAAESIAARILKDIDPILSAYCLRAAREDWEFALDAITGNTKSEYSKFSAELQLAGAFALASIELYRMTGEQKYVDKAFEQARYIMNCQQKTPTDWDIPLSGFFYRTAGKQTILRYFHRSHSQGHIVALSELCEEFPDYPEWIEWYSSIVLYTEYVKKIVKYTSPYNMFPCSIYKIDESTEPDFRSQVLNGIRLSDEYYLRIFPVWFAFRGNNSMLLSDAKALSSSAWLRRDPKLIELSQAQLEWVVGKNPFSQSMMYGEGYDYAPQYTAMSGDIVGSLPVGIQTSVNKDVPYWPFNNCYNYKEVWVQPSARWLWLMSDLSGSAKVSGKISKDSDGLIEFVNSTTGKTTVVEVEKGKDEFYVVLSEGQYSVKFNGYTKRITLLPGEDYSLDLCRFYDIRVESSELNGKELTLKLSLESNCELQLELRANNINLPSSKLDIASTCCKSMAIELRGCVVSDGEPWFLVLIPNGNHSEKIEVHG